MDGEKVVTYYEAILQEKLPKSVVVIGSGAIDVDGVCADGTLEPVMRAGEWASAVR